MRFIGLCVYNLNCAAFKRELYSFEIRLVDRAVCVLHTKRGNFHRTNCFRGTKARPRLSENIFEFSAME